MKWQIKSPEEYITKVREKISVQEMRAFLIVFLAGISLYMPMIVCRLNCSDGNICGIIYRPHSDYDMEDIAGRYLLKYVAHMKSMFVFSWLAVILGLLFLTWGGHADLPDTQDSFDGRDGDRRSVCDTAPLLYRYVHVLFCFRCVFILFCSGSVCRILIT